MQFLKPVRHGDCAPHTEADSLLPVSMRSMTSRLPVDYSQLVVLPEKAYVLACANVKPAHATAQVQFTVPKCIITEKMMKDVWDTLVDSFKRLANKKTAMVYALIGDLDYFYTEFGFPRHNSPKPCPWCHCNQSPVCNKLVCFFSLWLDLLHASAL